MVIRGPLLFILLSLVVAPPLGSYLSLLVFGFGGVRDFDGQLSIDPRLPTAWRSLSFPLRFRNRQIRVELEEVLGLRQPEEPVLPEVVQAIGPLQRSALPNITRASFTVPSISGAKAKWVQTMVTSSSALEMTAVCTPARRRMRAMRAWFVLAFPFVAAACGDGGTSDEPTDEPSVTEDLSGGTLTMAMLADVTAAFDPQKEYYSVTWEYYRCCLLRTLMSYEGVPTDAGGLAYRERGYLTATGSG